MAVPSNILQQVQTYQMSQLAFLGNFGCFIHTSNKKFQNFENMVGNLGDTVNFELPPRFVSQEGLVVNYQPTQQRLQSLTVNQAQNTSYAYTAQQMIFNVEDYMLRVGKGAVMELATEVESDVATLAETAPYRFFGDGVTQINSFGQLANLLAQYRTYGFAKDNIKVYLSDIAVPQIVNSGLNQFVLDRNDEMANSWMVGDWMGVSYYQSNLLPVHLAGMVGNLNQTLTVVSTNDPTGNNITQITFSGASVSDPDAIHQYDSLQFQDGVVGQPNLRYLTFVGHKPSSALVQMQATAPAASDGGGNVVVDIFPPLCATIGNANQNLQHNIVAGMQVKVLPDHRCGLVVGGNALYLAMPKLPDQAPFYTGNEMDPDTGVSLRLTYGAVLGQNQLCYVNDIIWGKTAPGEYLMKIAFPV
jgi:P22 coat protein - gene protein 5